MIGEGAADHEDVDRRGGTCIVFLSEGIGQNRISGVHDDDRLRGRVEARVKDLCGRLQLCLRDPPSGRGVPWAHTDLVPSFVGRVGPYR